MKTAIDFMPTELEQHLNSFAQELSITMYLGVIYNFVFIFIMKLQSSNHTQLFTHLNITQPMTGAKCITYD